MPEVLTKTEVENLPDFSGNYTAVEFGMANGGTTE
jgi:hypothetical protein